MDTFAPDLQFAELVRRSCQPTDVLQGWTLRANLGYKRPNGCRDVAAKWQSRLPSRTGGWSRPWCKCGTRFPNPVLTYQ